MKWFFTVVLNVYSGKKIYSSSSSSKYCIMRLFIPISSSVCNGEKFNFSNILQSFKEQLLFKIWYFTAPWPTLTHFWGKSFSNQCFNQCILILILTWALNKVGSLVLVAHNGIWATLPKIRYISYSYNKVLITSLFLLHAN